jgi:aminopeptidase
LDKLDRSHLHRHGARPETTAGRRDPRYDVLARLLVQRSLDVQPGWQVTIRSTPLARELVEALCRHIARRGAFARTSLMFGYERYPVEQAWAEEAPLEMLGELAPIERRAIETEDAWVRILAPETVLAKPALPAERHRLVQQSLEPLQRRQDGDVRWAITQFATGAAAQAAGMTRDAFEDAIFDACLRDWDAERERMLRVAERFDRAEAVRIVGAGTDIELSIADRRGQIDHALRNMPGGEVYYSPVEDSAEGVIEYGEFPASYFGAQVEGARLVFQGGVVVDASARFGEDVLIEALETDPGARRLGELGLGCNEGLTRAFGMPNFDEKIAGTVHLAIGDGFPLLGGRNESAIHWDMVKDLRRGGELWCDGQLVQRDGAWQL